MKAYQLKEKFLTYFKKRGHQITHSASLIPSEMVELAGTQRLLFTTAGMHPLIPYLLGQPHPQGQRITNVQKCLRTDDIEDIGDAWHNTFFEMLGNWSIGDKKSPDGIGKSGYWKEDSIKWSFEFLTNELGLDPKRIFITVFGGDKQLAGVDKDSESITIWQNLGIPRERIYQLGKKDNFWGPVGKVGPCGPDTEIFYDIGASRHSKNCHPGDDCGKFVEIWNNVFMEFNLTSDGKYQPLKQKNVDTGMGVERTIAILQGKDNVYDTELFSQVMDSIKGISDSWNTTFARIIADHLRAATFLLSDGVQPSNVERGYILRRLIRRAIRYGKQLEIEQEFTSQIAQAVIDNYKKDYPGLVKNRKTIKELLIQEEKRFGKALIDGLKKTRKVFDKKIPVTNKKYKKVMQTFSKKEMFRQVYQSKGKEEGNQILKKFGIPLNYTQLKNATISGKETFDLYQTFGFPAEIIIELAQAKNLFIDLEDFEREVAKHQQISRAGVNKKFIGGLADSSKKTTQGHTATHLLHQALRDVLGEQVYQTGSNITADRIRFDFSYPQKLTQDQVKNVEAIVNQKIRANLPVNKTLMTQKEANEKGAVGLFKEKYGDKVSIYQIGPSASLGQAYSIEYCGGPHVTSTGILKGFKIRKEGSVGAGKRRIYAELTPTYENGR